MASHCAFIESNNDIQPQEHARWANLPPELLHNILAAAHQNLCSPPCQPGHAPAATGTQAAAWRADWNSSQAEEAPCGVPVHGQPPSLAQLAALRLATECCCRTWGEVASDLPLHVALGRSPLPPGATCTDGSEGAAVPTTASLCRWLGRRRLEALHFEAWPQVEGCRPGAMQQLAIELLASAELAAAAATLRELAVWDYLSSRPLCALLPRFPALRSLALTGYAIDLDLSPLCNLPHLSALHIEAEALPRLSPLPATLRHLSFSCFANAARVSLPLGLCLDSLVCHCPGQHVFLGLSRVLRQCQRTRITGRRIHLLLHVPAATLHDVLPPGAAPAGAASDAAAHLLLHEFEQSSRAESLALEAPSRQLVLKLAALSDPAAAHTGAAAAAAGGFRTILDAAAVCASAAQGSGSVSARVTAEQGTAAVGAPLEARGMHSLLLLCRAAGSKLAAAAAGSPGSQQAGGNHLSLPAHP